MAVNGIRGVVEAAIRRASGATGVDAGFLMKTARRESGFNPSAQAKTSSAAGLFQFVEQTWLATVKRHGAKHGYAGQAQAIVKGEDGRYRVSGGEGRRAVMDLRFDASAASVMAGELASDHADYLRARVGRDPSAGELYAAHFLGPQGSARLIEAMRTRPDAPAANIFPEAARANRPIFYREGRAATVAEVYANLTRTGGSGDAVAPDPSDYIQFAGGRRAQQMAEEQVLVAMLLRGTLEADRMGGQRLTGSLFTSEMLKVLSEGRET